MPSWNALIDELGKQTNPQAAGNWLKSKQISALRDIGKLRGDRHVLCYMSGFLQKPQAPPWSIQIMPEDLNGFMSAIFGMKWEKGLTLVLHTPGGVTNAAETIVDYLSSKFSDIEVIIPAFAMSAGTMISLASDRIVMGRQSQLGPIDPQLQFPGGSVSARSIVDQFERAKSDILANTTTAHAWAPVLQSLGPALLQEAQNALDYGERMVATWLERRMFKAKPNAVTAAKATAAHFNDASKHKSHGRRIDRDEARANSVTVEDLEPNQKLQEAVLTSYHLSTIGIERSQAVKFIQADTGQMWMKNWSPTP